MDAYQRIHVPARTLRGGKNRENRNRKIRCVDDYRQNVCARRLIAPTPTAPLMLCQHQQINIVLRMNASISAYGYSPEVESRTFAAVLYHCGGSRRWRLRGNVVEDASELLAQASPSLSAVGAASELLALASTSAVGTGVDVGRESQGRAVR